MDRLRSLPWLRLLPAAIALACLGCGEAPPPNVLLVTIDTLRADRMSAYGHARDTTPWLSELAADGVRFDRAYASSSWTAPSVVSLLTSLEPATHGIEHGHLKDRVIVEQEVIPDALPFWPELLRNAGYRTFGITANTHLYGRFGFARGFDRYECVGFLDADRVLEVLLGWRDEIADSQPWFVWIHLLDPHARYTPRAPWIGDWFPDYRREWQPLRHVLVPGSYKELGAAPGTRRFELVQALYDSEIRYSDEAIRVAATALNLSERDLVVVTSDHGEEFLEHDHFGHGVSLFEEVLRVPLLLRLPGLRHAGRVIDTPVAAIDVLPSVLDALDLPAPPELQGRSLLPLLEGDAAEEVAVSASLARFPYLGKDALIQGRWKLVKPRNSEERLLFDLESDPGEQTDVSERERERSEAMALALARRLEAARERRVEPGSVELSSEELEQLEALGYVPR
jgi:arylsulfatase A-like enzyme